MGVTEDRYRRAARDIKRLEWITYRKGEITRIITKESTDNIETLLPEYDSLQIEEGNTENNLKIEFKASSIAEIINILRKKNFLEASKNKGNQTTII
ncbi:hypothetical protein [Bacteroides nordii]|jgi:hypothetical protein|uniref:hypothetical protein n=1 Tax=Bacteroides nordii TaxID=291645 RepID=UPI0018AB8885|nr:hypothetical protein [Bacteroides nordii]